MKCYCCTLWTFTVFSVILINLVKGLNENLSELSREEFGDVTEEPNSNDLSLRTFGEDVVKKNLVFHYFKNGIKTLEDTGLEANLTETGCLPTDKFAFIIHGWGQDCEVEWILRLREKLTIRRGGCIVCVDYGNYREDSYLRLLRYFRPMTNAITTKLEQLKTEGFDPSRGFIFGFSLGGQMATAIGKLFGPQPLKQIDTCDMAGPGFDFRRIADHRGAAERVTCWHTSRNKGTRFYACHQNVRFGNCGYSQPAEGALLSSHGLCVQYYINSFEHPFFAMLQPSRCMSRNPAVFIPNNYTVGYTEDSNNVIPGEVFVPTAEAFPYNLPLEQVLLLNSLARGNNLFDSNIKRIPYRRRFPVFIQNARNRLLQRITD